ncbi:MAG: peptidylprolyl isomerase [Thermoanaerobaculales bacterium]
MRTHLLTVAAASALWAVFSSMTMAADAEPVARVGTRSVSRAMLDDAVSQALNKGYYHRNLTPERRRTLEIEQIQELIRRELNLFGAFERGMELPQDEAEAQRSEIEKRLGKEAYEAALKGAGMTAADHARALAETLLAERAYQRFVVAPSTVDEDEVRKAFTAAPERWRMPESAHVLHILLKVAPDADAAMVVAAKERADELLQRIRDGEDFGAVAANHSEDMYRVKGGDLGWIHRNRLLGPLETAVWSAEIGEVVGPVRSDEGFHIAQVVERRPARQMEFAEVAPMLLEEMTKQRLEATEAAWFAGLRERHPVVILDPDLREGS